MDMYDIGASDLKELFDSDLDPAMQDTLKLTTDADMHDWFLERGDGRLPGVILNDKLMTDAILATFPIKTEHSYSLTSDGDSMPDSPNSLQNKMDDMDEECYPAIAMQNNNNNSNCSNNNNNPLSINNNSRLLSLINNSTHNNNNNSSLVNQNLNHHNLINSHSSPSTPSAATANPILNSSIHSLSSSSAHSNSLTLTNSSNSLTNGSCHNNNNNNNTSHLNQLIMNQFNSDSSSTTSSLSDIDIDECHVKDEPISPSSSCPPSPNGDAAFNMSMSMANIANYTRTDLVFEHKNGTMQLSQASHNLLKSQQSQLMLDSPTSQQQQQQQQRLMLPKFNVKMETQSSTAFGLPPTPPSSLPSDESEGNQSPEHRLSPMSPPAPVAGHSRRNSHTAMGGHHSSPTYSSSSSRNFTSSSSGSTRQPIHTPLISSQPKGSTGTLMLTEEEKRTLLAEGYPIPTRLPLTKAEEKSLKKIRRKIKNKISAQESRRKKKEYMDQLERKVEILVAENTDYRKRCDTLEDSNASLLAQLKQLQAMINRQNGKK